jgi:hypothetical protein
MVRRVCSALPFCGEVKNAQEEALLNLRLLSHWTALMVRLNYVETKAKKFDNVAKVSDFTRKEKVYTK